MVSTFYGVAETRKGYTVCLLQEDGIPLMTFSKPFESSFDAWMAARIRNATMISPLARCVEGALLRAEIFEPLGIEL